MNRLLLALVCAAACTAPASPGPVSPAPPSIDLAARRAQMIGWLHAYREGDSYPVDDSGLPTGVFMDAHGTRCPMSELIHKSGRDDLVSAVVAEDNRVRLAAVHDGPLYDWMLGSGLTQDEIEMVQGVLSVDEMRLVKQSHDQRLASARAEVRRKLAAAEATLRHDTPTALATARERLPRRPLITGPVHGRVLPASSRDTSAALETTRASPRSSESSR